MKNKKTLSISDARKNIYDIAEDVQKPGVFFTLTEKGVPKVVILSAEEFDNLMEDLEMMSDPESLANIKKAEEEYARGEYIDWEDLKKELGLVNYSAVMVKEKPGTPYKVKKNLKRKAKRWTPDSQ